MASVLQMIHIDNQSPSLLIDEEFLRNSMLVTKCYNDLAKRRLYRWTYMFFNVISVYTLPTITIFFNIQLIRTLHRVKSHTTRLRAKSSVNGNNQHYSHQTKYSVTIMIITIVLTILICRIVRRFHNIANLIAITNIATNFLPFCVFGQLFCAEYNNDNYENLLNKQKIIININIQKATQIHNEHLQNILPLNSETTSSSPNHSSSPCSKINIIKLYDSSC
ncbi:unnamed protein product [Rotaria sordida]|uniref:Uncharacterized protein n=1 Tax=Rotaria sordida TaxID=392033 RepID=A0A815BRW9_9BILA|nr:unnamed protein product [Rotaria sordida]